MYIIIILTTNEGIRKLVPKTEEESTFVPFEDGFISRFLTIFLIAAKLKYNYRNGAEISF